MKGLKGFINGYMDDFDQVDILRGIVWIAALFIMAVGTVHNIIVWRQIVRWHQ